MSYPPLTTQFIKIIELSFIAHRHRQWQFSCIWYSNDPRHRLYLIQQSLRHPTIACIWYSNLNLLIPGVFSQLASLRNTQASFSYDKIYGSASTNTVWTWPRRRPTGHWSRICAIVLARLHGYQYRNSESSTMCHCLCSCAIYHKRHQTTPFLLTQDSDLLSRRQFNYTLPASP